MTLRSLSQGSVFDIDLIVTDRLVNERENQLLEKYPVLEVLETSVQVRAQSTLPL